MYAFKINGIPYDVFVPEDGIKRAFSVADTENSGRGVDGDMIRDIIGTFYNYTIEIYPNVKNPSEYYKVYNLLSSPVESHLISVPYNNGWLNYQAYVTSGTDTLRTLKNGSKWHGLSIKFTAMSPQWRENETLNGYEEF